MIFLPEEIIKKIMEYNFFKVSDNKISNNFIICIRTNYIIDSIKEIEIRDWILKIVCQLNIKLGHLISKVYTSNPFEIRFAISLGCQYINSNQILQLCNEELIYLINKIDIKSYDNNIFKYDYFYYYLERGNLLNTTNMYQINKFSYKKILENSLSWGWDNYPFYI